MSDGISGAVWAVLRCSCCGGTLSPADDGAECALCSTKYPINAANGLDLRLRRVKEAQLTFVLGEAPLSSDDLPFEPLKLRPNPPVDFDGVAVPHHLTTVLLSHFPKAANSGSLALDLGCGDGVHRGVIERAGFEYVGVDYSHHKAPILADGHALPFADNTFDFILSIAVLEHIRYPHVMMGEALRVLKPGGELVGSVAFLEPFHQDSHYHHTHLGTYNSLRQAGFDIDAIAPEEGWTVLRAQAEMALFPRMPDRLKRLMVAPVELAHRAWWRLLQITGKSEPSNQRILHTTGSFFFIAHKPTVA